MATPYDIRKIASCFQIEGEFKSAELWGQGNIKIHTLSYLTTSVTTRNT